MSSPFGNAKTKFGFGVAYFPINVETPQRNSTKTYTNIHGEPEFEFGAMRSRGRQLINSVIAPLTLSRTITIEPTGNCRLLLYDFARLCSRIYCCWLSNFER